MTEKYAYRKHLGLFKVLFLNFPGRKGITVKKKEPE
jgi:hypothetical protein